MAEKHDYDHSADEDLMVLIQNGDHRAFSILVERYINLFYRAALRMVGAHRSQDAEDIVQEAFIKLWVRPESWEPARGVKFTTWFYKVVMNLSLDCLRKKSPPLAGGFAEQIEDERVNAQQKLEMEDQKKALEVAIQSLPDSQRAALNLCVYEELSQKEAADILGVHIKALESLLSRAKAGVKDYLYRAGYIEDKGRGQNG